MNAPTRPRPRARTAFRRACAASAARRSLRLGGDQRGDDADQHQRGHRHIARSARPRCWSKPERLEAADQEQRAGGRDQHADAIGRDVGRHAGGLLVLGQALDAEGVDDDVLRRRGGRDQQRAERDQRRARRRDRRSRGTRSPPSAESARTPASRGGGRAAATAPARRAHRPAAPTGTSPCRACRPARTGRWCRDRRRISRIQTSSVEPDSASGRPDEKPRNSTISTRGLR